MTKETSKHLRSEKYLERELVRRVRQMGGRALKYYNSIEIGYPDRLILMPGGRIAWVEMKSQGEKPTKIQAHRHEELRALGFKVFVIDSLEGIQTITKELQNGRDEEEAQGKAQKELPYAIHS